MSRKARQKSNTGIYHVIIRGVNRKEIFHDEIDHLRFLETLLRYKIKSKIKVHGWCLMNNHVHLLIEEGNEDLSATMKRIGVSYVWYYNQKYDAVGHLFQDRYRSECVESMDYLLTVIRYIHQNPVKAKLVKYPSEWKWSSCIEYYGGEPCLHELLDSELILGLFSNDGDNAVKRFIKFNEIINNDKCLDDDVVLKLKDEEVILEIEKIVSNIGVAQIKTLPKTERDSIIKKAKCINGITQNQLARILGVSQSLISQI